MANINDLITASIYNAIRTKVNRVLGPGDGAEFGYGQPLLSSLKADNDLITSQDMQNLYEDLLKSAKHQTGNPPVWTNSDGLNAPDPGEVIGIYAADVGASGTTIDATVDLAEGFLDFEQAATQIETNRFNIGAGATSAAAGVESIRTSAWKTSVDHIVTVTWATADARRTWANAGGKIRFNANLTGGTSQPGEVSLTPPGTKDEIWQTMLNSAGTISMGVQGTATTGTGTANSNASIIYSNRSSTTNWSSTSESNSVNIYTKNGSGVYSENEFRIDAWQVAANSMRFKISFIDFDLGDDQNPGAEGSTPIDENVTGTITSTVSYIVPNGFLNHTTPTTTTDSQL
jgi:hypothetical protein